MYWGALWELMIWQSTGFRGCSWRYTFVFGQKKAPDQSWSGAWLTS